MMSYDMKHSATNRRCRLFRESLIEQCADVMQVWMHRCHAQLCRAVICGRVDEAKSAETTVIEGDKEECTHVSACSPPSKASSFA